MVLYDTILYYAILLEPHDFDLPNPTCCILKA
jgi:hypothetical protein